VDPIEALAAEPGRSALLFDVDGTLAPIVPHPEDATVPEETRRELDRLTGRYALVAAVTGRPTEVARRMIGVTAVEVVGEHGLELDAEAAAWADRLHAFVDAAPMPAERKPLSASFHWRTDPGAEPLVLQIAAAAEAAGFRVRRGRMVVDVLPPTEASKATGVRFLLERHAQVRQALFAGDDTTDLDAFRGLREATLERAVCVGVVTPESPPAIAEQADVVVGGTDELLELLRRL
jgi:trehalose 6-phosphate phosphatase